MTEKFKIGDRVSWNSDERQVSGTIIRMYTHNVHNRGGTLQTTEEDPVCEIKNGGTIETTLVRCSALRKLND